MNRLQDISITSAINIRAFLMSMLWSAYTEYDLKKEELNKYLHEVTSYWEEACVSRPGLRQKAEKNITEAKQYVDKALATAEKRFLRKEMAAERLAEKQMTAIKVKALRRSEEEDFDLGVLDVYLSFQPNDVRIQRHQDIISSTEYDRIERRRDVQTNKLATYRKNEKSRQMDRRLNRQIKQESHF